MVWKICEATSAADPYRSVSYRACIHLGVAKLGAPRPGQFILACMTSLDVDTVLRLGGWDVRYTNVVFVAEREDVAIALFDADSDLNLDDFERHSDGTWHHGAMSGSAPERGPGMQGRVAYDYGQAEAGTPIIVDYQGEAHTVITAENGWWAFVARLDPKQPGSLPVRRSSSRRYQWH